MGRYNRYPRRRGQGINWSIFLFIIIFALAAGYAGTRFIVYPYFLGNNPMEKVEQEDAGDEKNTEGSGVTSPSSIIIDQQEIKDIKEKKEDGTTTGTNLTGVTVSGITDSKGPFSVQFGSFTTKEGAEAFSGELSAKGIYSYTYEREGSHKVLGVPYAEKTKALEAMASVSAQVPDAFVVDMTNLIKSE